MEEKQRILLCEDDENLGMLLREYLQAKGYYAELCPDGDAGYKAFVKGKFDICVLDVMMPIKDGFTLAQEIRQADSEIPIIFLTAKTLNEDILEGFKIGADDYITKPFSMEVLVVRIETVLRRVCGKKNKENTMYKIGRFVFDTQKQLLVIDDQQIDHLHAVPIPFVTERAEALHNIPDLAIVAKHDHIFSFDPIIPVYIDRIISGHLHAHLSE
jgi:DNA-binding response OmpR family regulator